MIVAIVIPTIGGRAEHLARRLQAYGRTAPNVDLYVENDHGSRGEARVAGAEKTACDGDLYFSADDLEPHDGLDVAVETVDGGLIPAPPVRKPRLA